MDTDIDLHIASLLFVEVLTELNKVFNINVLAMMERIIWSTDENRRRVEAVLYDIANENIVWRETFQMDEMDEGFTKIRR